MRRRTDDVSTRSTATRRTVLRTLGAGGLAGPALGAGSASARETAPALDAIAAGYRSPAAARAAVDATGRAVIAELATRGFLDGAGLDQFDFAGATVAGLLGPDGATGQVSVSRSTATHEVEVVVRPEAGEAYATARPTGDGRPFTVRRDDDGVSTFDGTLETGCGGSHCYDLLCDFRETIRSVDGTTEVVRRYCCVCE